VWFPAQWGKGPLRETKGKEMLPVKLNQQTEKGKRRVIHCPSKNSSHNSGENKIPSVRGKSKKIRGPAKGKRKKCTRIKGANQHEGRQHHPTTHKNKEKIGKKTRREEGKSRQKTVTTAAKTNRGKALRKKSKDLLPKKRVHLREQTKKKPEGKRGAV